MIKTERLEALCRDEYGMIGLAQAVNPLAGEKARGLILSAQELIRQAERRGKIDKEHDGMEWERISRRIGSKKIGTATHHEIYDVSPDGRKALLCIRKVEGTKYGVKTLSKDYYIISKHGTGVRVEPAKKAVAAKAALAAGQVVGWALAVAAGRTSLADRHLLEVSDSKKI